MRAAVLLFLFALSSFPQTKIVLVGDSTVTDRSGWGTGFTAALGPNYEVVNLSKGGRSSKSFLGEGLWEPALAEKPGYILIQFGHNDVPGKGPDRETDPNATFRDNLRRYVRGARNIGAKPILITSIIRRKTTPEGKVIPDSLVPYAEATRAVAKAENVPLIDLYALTFQQCESLGATGCAELNTVTSDGKPDTTHLGPKGKREIGALAAREFLKLAR
jgi:pectinesterase